MKIIIFNLVYLVLIISYVVSDDILEDKQLHTFDVDEVSVTPVTLGPSSTSFTTSSLSISTHQIPLTNFSDFIIPNEISDHEDSFTYDKNIELIFVNVLLPWSQANLYCESILKGSLAMIRDEDMASFTTEALFETSKNMDNLWIGGIFRNNKKWTWIQNSREKKQIHSDLLTKYLVQRDSELSVNYSRNCLSFGRKNHDLPLFVDLSCEMLRPFICERAAYSDVNNSGSTHHGWIPSGDRLYKIYRDKVTYDQANLRCFQHDQKSTLAILENPSDILNIGRYLLIGRPSLEYAWFGGKYLSNKKQWGYPGTDILLSNKAPGEMGEFPPWRSKLPIPSGCGLLDRHISDKVLFIEARCDRLRPYICSKPAKEDNITNIDFTNFGDYDYRLYLPKLTWEEALNSCKEINSGKLAEPKNKTDLNLFMQFMGENRTSVHHIWLGGQYQDDEWHYATDNKLIPTGLAWVKNYTYSDDVEGFYECLNLDRENHLEPLLYGTICSYPQSYLCQYDKGVLTKSN